MAHMDGRVYPACAACCDSPALDVKAGPKRPRFGGVPLSPMRGVILSIVAANPGVSLKDLTIAAGVDRADRRAADGFQSLVKRMNIEGKLRRERSYRAARYWIAEARKEAA